MTLFIWSCQGNTDEYEHQPPPLYEAPYAFTFNPEGGYSINPLTGEPILPIITESGDTLKTGVPQKLIERKVAPSEFIVDTVSVPPTSEWVQIKEGYQQDSIFDKFEIQEIFWDTVHLDSTYKVKSNFVFKDENRDDIPTATPIPVKADTFSFKTSPPEKLKINYAKKDAKVNFWTFDQQHELSNGGSISFNESKSLFSSTPFIELMKINGPYKLSYDLNLEIQVSKQSMVDSKGQIWSIRREMAVIFDGTKARIIRVKNFTLQIVCIRTFTCIVEVIVIHNKKAKN